MNAKMKFLLLVVMGGLVATNQSKAQLRLFLENNYGASLVFKVHNGNKADSSKPINNQETVIRFQDRKLLGMVPFDAKMSKEWVNSLDIRADHYYSSYTSLESYLEKITQELAKCCTLRRCPDKCQMDAFIVVYPSSVVSGWDIKLEWRDPKRAVIASW